MTILKCQAYIKSLGCMAPVVAIDFKNNLVQVNLINDQDKSPKYKFEDVKIIPWNNHYDKNGKELYEGDIVLYNQHIFTDCERLEVERIEKTKIGEFYLSENLWPGIRFKDGSGLIFHAGGLYTELEFEKKGNVLEDPELLGILELKLEKV